MDTHEIHFNQWGLVPAIVQDFETGDVLMMAYMNIEALEKTLETGYVHFYSRSRRSLWKKGETSGHLQLLKEIRIDCDGDAILVKAEQITAACHTGHRSCFYRKLEEGTWVETDKPVFIAEEVYKQSTHNDTTALQKANLADISGIFNELYEIISDRKINPKEGSYTTSLFTKGIDRILKKVGEEASEVIIAAKNPDKGELIFEISDLIYHLTILMVEKGVSYDDIMAELKSRR